MFLPVFVYFALYTFLLRNNLNFRNIEEFYENLNFKCLQKITFMFFWKFVIFEFYLRLGIGNLTL